MRAVPVWRLQGCPGPSVGKTGKRKPGFKQRVSNFGTRAVPSGERCRDAHLQQRRVDGILYRPAALGRRSALDKGAPRIVSAAVVPERHFVGEVHLHTQILGWKQRCSAEGVEAVCYSTRRPNNPGECAECSRLFPRAMPVRWLFQSA